MIEEHTSVDAPRPFKTYDVLDVSRGEAILRALIIDVSMCNHENIVMSVFAKALLMAFAADVVTPDELSKHISVDVSTIYEWTFEGPARPICALRGAIFEWLLPKALVKWRSRARRNPLFARLSVL